MKRPKMWEVVQGGTVVCTGMTKEEAENKVENERRLGNAMKIQRTPKKLKWFPPEIED